MYLIQAIKSDFSNVNRVNSSPVQNVQNNVNTDEQKAVKVDKIEVEHFNQRSFSLNLTKNINQIANIETAQTHLNKSLQIVNNFEKLISNNSSSLDNVQSQIQSSISTFNSSSKSLTDSMSKIIEEKQNEDSRMYFDGILGSKPLSGEEIYEAIVQQKEKLEEFGVKLKDELTQTTQKAKEVIGFEKENSASQKEFSVEVNFEQDSKAFEAKTVQNHSGSMAQTQANAEPYTAELITAS